MVLAKPYTGSLGKAESGVKPTMGRRQEPKARELRLTWRP
jgi:hypothetical protein